MDKSQGVLYCKYYHEIMRQKRYTAYGYHSNDVGSGESGQPVTQTSVKKKVLLRGIIVNRTYGTHKHLYVSRFLLNKIGPIYYAPPLNHSSPWVGI